MSEVTIEHERAACLYFTADLTNSKVWEYSTIEGNELAFVEECRNSSQVLVRAPHWAEIVNAHAKLLDYFEPATKHAEVLSGRLGSVVGCDLITDAFCSPEAKDTAEPTIVFIPRV